MVSILGAPFDGSGARPGSRLGPAALEMAGLADALEDGHFGVRNWKNLLVEQGEDTAGGLRNFRALNALLKSLKHEVTEILKVGDFPIVLGGEHSISIGGISAALGQFPRDLAILWIDAHADLNTPGRSPSGNIHGMPLAALCGLPSEASGVVHDQWAHLCRLAEPHFVQPHKIAWFGLRDVDRGERELISSMPQSLPISMFDIDRDGVVSQIDRFHQWMVSSGSKRLWISFDVDALDPILAPGTGTAVRGGLTYREGHLLAEYLCSIMAQPDCPYQLAGLDVVETNPIEDDHNATAKVAVEWIASLFGKTILGVGR